MKQKREERRKKCRKEDNDVKKECREIERGLSKVIVRDGRERQIVGRNMRSRVLTAISTPMISLQLHFTREIFQKKKNIWEMRSTLEVEKGWLGVAHVPFALLSLTFLLATSSVYQFFKLHIPRIPEPSSRRAGIKNNQMRTPTWCERTFPIAFSLSLPFLFYLLACLFLCLSLFLLIYFWQLH